MIFDTHFFQETNLTTNAKNPALSQLNGSTELAGNQWKDLILNGKASLGQDGRSTIFEGVIVINGNCSAQFAQFDVFEVNGNVKIQNCEIRKKMEIFGNAKVYSTKAKNISLRGKSFLLKDSKISGDVVLHAFQGKNNKLILDNTVISGKLEYPKDSYTIELINNSRISN